MKNQKKKWKSSYGAVTVFLAIVLLPCMIFVCAFGDVSRVMLSKSQAAAAADLSLYALMSNYDEDLKEWYGLVASCQDIDTFYDKAEEYFLGMMKASGIEGTAGEGIQSYISGLKNGGDVVDFLQIADAGTTTVGPATNGTLRNPALLEDGIVEFMKYRGPVEMVTNTIERFSSLDLAGGLGDAEKDQPIVEAKQEFAEAEGEMMEEMLATYLAIVNYDQYLQNNKLPSFENYELSAADLTVIKADFKGATQLITNYYAATDGIRNMSDQFPLRTLPSLTGSGENMKVTYNGTAYKLSSIGAEEKKSESNSESEEGEGETGSQSQSQEETIYVLTDADLKGFLTGNTNTANEYWLYSSYINNVETAANSLYQAVSEVVEPGDSTDNLAIYCMQMQNAWGSTDNFATIGSNGTKLMVLYAKILLALECELPAWQNGTDGDYWRTLLNSMKNSIESCQRNYLSYNSYNTDYERVLGQYASVAKSTVSKVQNRQYTFYSDFCEDYVTLGEFLSAVRTEFNSLYTQIKSQIDRINLALAGGTVTYNGRSYTAVDIDDLAVLIKNYTTARENWGSLADAGTTDYAVQEQEEYHAEAGNVNFAAALRDIEDPEGTVKELKTRLTNIRDDMQGLLDALDAFTYGGSAIYKMTADEAITAAKTVIDTSVITRNITANNNHGAEFYNSLIAPRDTAVYTAATLVKGSQGNHPILNEEIPELYQYMLQAMPLSKLDEITDAVDDAESKEEQDKKAAEEAKAGAESSESYVDDLGKDPGAGSGGSTFTVGTAITGVLDAVSILIDGNFDEYRDKLYVVEYAMDMFSYSSFNNEGQYQLYEESNPAEHSTFQDFNEKTKAYTEDVQKQWSEASATDIMDNQSLTNQHISSANNYSNLAEIEYILFGKATNEENLKAAYSGIYSIRLALNLVSAFQNFYTINPSGSDSAYTTAVAIEGIASLTMSLSCGIIPIPVTKVLLLGVLAAVETGRDVNRLKAGLPVALYKGDDDWWCGISVSGGTGRSFLGIDDSKPVDPNGLFYSDYIYLFMLMASMNDLVYTGMLNRIGDLIQNNMNERTGGFSLDKAVCYFNLNSTLQVQPLLITLPLMNNTYDGISSDSLIESKGWCTYSVSLMRGYS